jgi:hypothetical protein
MTMRELRDRFHDADLVEPPDVFSDALRREPMLDVDKPSRKGKAAVIVVSLVVAVVAIGFAVLAFTPSNNGGSVPAAQTPPVVPADPCDLITSDDVEAATGSTVTSSGIVPPSQMIDPSSNTKICAFDTDGRYGSITTVSEPTGAAAKFEELAADPNADPVTGFDDQAFVSGGAGIWVKVGDGYFTIGSQLGAGDGATAVVTTLAHDAVEALATPSAVAAPTESTASTPESPHETAPDQGIDLVCHEDGTTTARSDALTATAQGVPVTVWSPDGTSMLWVVLPNWMPFDNQFWSMEKGQNTFTLMAPPGSTLMGCVQGADHGDTLDPATSVRMPIVDPDGFFAPATVDCGGDAPDTRVFSVLSAVDPALTGGTPKKQGLVETIRTYLSGVVDSDEIAPAMYPADRQFESALVLREGHPLALVSRTKDGTDFPTPLRVTTCKGSGLGRN